jgi:2-dehydro-3-deoxygluconokinase
MEPSAAATPSVLSFGEALVGYGTVEDNLRVATSFTRFPGGADLNVAVGLTRLGTRATWASVLGDDAHGDYLIDAVAELGVGLAVRRATGPTALMFKAGGQDADPEVLQVRRATAFAEQAGTVLTTELLSFAGLTHLHLTGITLGISPESRAAALTLLEVARSHGATVSFDPNLRLNLWPDRDEMRTIVNAVAAQATIVLPGLGEGELLTGQTDPAAIADFYLEAGVEQVVLKIGADGARAWDGSETVTSRPYRVVPIDTVGAGDGFAAGYLDAFLAGQDLQDCVDQAAAVGALVTTRRGDLAAMPTRAELDAFLAPRVGQRQSMQPSAGLREPGPGRLTG